MAYQKPSDLSYKWKLPLLVEVIQEIYNDPSIPWCLKYDTDITTEDEFKKAFSVGKTVAKPALRAAAPFIPVLGAVGVGLGAADVAKAAEFTKKPDELGLAYLLGPEKAKDYSEFKESIRGKADETEEFVP